VSVCTCLASRFADIAPRFSERNGGYSEHCE
jgi:ribosomal protein L17